MFQKFNRYGNDPEVYQACTEPIRRSNRQHADIINWWFLLANILYYACAEFDFLNVDARMKWLYAAYVGVTIVFILLSRLVPKFRFMPMVPLIINIVILVSYGIAVSNAAPYTIAFMFMIILLVIATSYTLTMSRMVCILVVSVTIFIYFTYMEKPLSVSYQDICNVVIIMALSILLHYPFQKMRVRQFVINNQNKQIHRELEVKSSFDTLTALFSRNAFFTLGTAALEDHRPFMALCILDLDEFKKINDSLGHQVGDWAIRKTGEVITDVLGIDVSDKWEFKETVLKEGCSFAGRLGGDEFILLVRDKQDEFEVRAMMTEMIERLNRVEDRGVHGLRASVGVTRISAGDTDIDDAYKRADTALYQAKAEGKNQICMA